MKNSQNNSALCPYDANIWLKNIENWKIEGSTGRKTETPRACKGVDKREKSVFRGKKWQCQRHVGILRYENSNIYRAIGVKP